MVMHRQVGLIFLPLIISLGASAADPPRLIRSLSGPSGKAVGSNFVLDESRNRFVYPRDSSLVIYFQWEATVGNHVLTGSWKQPDGRVASISPDVKVETTNSELNCYWIFSLSPGLPNGVWTLEVRVDGQPAGSHPFEIAGMEAAPKQITIDQIFRTVGPSLVWIRKLDEAGRRIDTATGFVLQANSVGTAFQSIDAADKLEIEFSDGRRIVTSDVLAASRTGDWAVLRADTALLNPVPRGDPKKVLVGEHLAAFNFESSARVIGTVDVGGQSVVPGFGGRIQIAPAVAPEAAGGPLLDSSGQIVGILGGSLNPGARVERRASSLSPGLWNLFIAENAATPISEVPENFSSAPKTLNQLSNEGVLTTPVVALSEFIYGGTTATLPKRASDPLPRDSSDFSKRDAEIGVYSLWSRKGKLSKGELSAKMYDSANRLHIDMPPKKISLVDVPQRYAFSFSPKTLQPGIYRIDLLWNGRPAWRTFIRIAE